MKTPRPTHHLTGKGLAAILARRASSAAFFQETLKSLGNRAKEPTKTQKGGDIPLKA